MNHWTYRQPKKKEEVPQKNYKKKKERKKIWLNGTFTSYRVKYHSLPKCL